MHMMRMRMRRMSPGGVLTGRWESKDRKLRPEMRTANQDHLMAMTNEMLMGQMKMRMRMLMIMLVMPMMMMMMLMEGMIEKTDKGKREINERERREKIEKIEERERKEIERKEKMRR